MMNTLTGGCFLFLALIINFSCAQIKYFRLEDKNLTATEGSCTEIKCLVTYESNIYGAHWFWMKDGKWSDGTFEGTVIYSSDQSAQPVSKDFADRVKYIGSPSSSWTYPLKPLTRCSVMICNLSRADSGNYLFRFINPRGIKWATEELNLTVTENPCPITFDEVPTAIENNTVTLRCSTSSSCPKDPQIEELKTKMLPGLSSKLQHSDDKKIATYSFVAEWQHDGITFSCQTQENKDVYLIRNINVTIEYAPKDTVAKISTGNIKKGQPVTFTCSTKGHPVPSITWFKNSIQVSTGATWSIPSVDSVNDGQYYCEAHNKHGTLKSTPVNIDVQYRPEVKVMMTSPAVVSRGKQVILTCNVTRSNPSPHKYSWLRNGRQIGSSSQFVKDMEPEDAGSYSCTATNSVGTGASNAIQISVQYEPRRTKISNDQQAMDAPAGKPLKFKCDADANPNPSKYSWYRYNKDSTKSYTTKVNELKFDRVERQDEACYMCNATNSFGTGIDSPPMCIKVLYPPTNLRLSMESEVTEGNVTTISCTVESYPLSSLTLEKSHATGSPVAPKPNSLTYIFTVHSTHAGCYTCRATNSQGSASTKSQLVVRFQPKDVNIQPQPALAVNENGSLTLTCKAQCHPAVTSYTWMKMSDDGKKNILENQKNVTLQMKSVSLTDRGLYSCEATNAIGTGYSPSVEVKVKYAPKQTNITRAAEKQHPDGKSSVMLSCSSDSYPPADEYSWYMKTKDREQDAKVFGGQNHTVFSDKPGEYYCVAKNEINQRSSEAVSLFVDRGLIFALRVFSFILLILVVALIFIVYSRRRKKSIQRASTSTASSIGSLGWWNCARRRNLRSEPMMSEPFRSRDDLLPEQLCRPEAQRHQPPPDSTLVSSTVYCTVNLPAMGQGASAQNPAAQQHEHTQDESLKYAALNFGKAQRSKPAAGEEGAVYAVVSKPKPAAKKGPENPPDYENVCGSNPLSYDTDTSEDEVEVNYSKVSFKAKSGPQKNDSDTSSETSSETSSDSSTSDGEETQYSKVKI